MRYVLLVSLISCAGAVAAEPVVLLEQDRQLEATINTWGLVDPPDFVATEQTAEPGPWNVTIDLGVPQPVEFFLLSGEDPDPVHLHGTQYSDITADVLTMDGCLELDSQVYLGSGEGFATRNETTFDVRLMVTEEILLNVAGFVTAFAESDAGYCGSPWLTAEAAVRVDQLAGPVVYERYFWFEATDGPTSQDLLLDAIVPLAPGVYDLSVVIALDASADGVVPGCDAWQNAELVHLMQFTFAPVEPEAGCLASDADDDGDVDLLDVYRLQQCYTGPGM